MYLLLVVNSNPSRVSCLFVTQHFGWKSVFFAILPTTVSFEACTRGIPQWLRVWKLVSKH